MSCHECGGGHATSYHTLSTQVRTTAPPPADATVTEVAPWSAFPQYVAGELPEDLEFVGGSTEEGKVWRVPVQRILPGGSLNPLRYTVPKKTADIEVPRGQVVPVFIPNAVDPVEKAKAAANTTAQALAISDNPNDPNSLVLQQTGFITFPRTHVYTVGKTYYLSPNVEGEVVSVRPSGGVVQPLFTVIDEVTLAVNVGAV